MTTIGEPTLEPDSRADPLLALVLSGGGAFGAAHVGVLQVLAERGIRPGMAVGTSSGALVAAAYAANIGIDAIDRTAREFRWSRIARWTTTPRWGLLDTTVIRHAVESALGVDPLIEDLPRRFAAYATDLRTRTGVILDEGPLSLALRSTIAVPGLLPPVRQGDRLLADGGMIDNVPATAARSLGASRLIVVRLHAKWENVRMMRTVTRTADLASDPSVVLVQPEMQHMAQWTMSDVPRLIDEGRRAAIAALDASALDLQSHGEPPAR